MKMTLRNLCVELWSKMRLGSISMILRLKAEYAMKTPWLSPTPKPQEIKKKFFSREGDGLYLFFDSYRVVMVDYLEEGRTINAYYAEELKQLRQEIVKKRRGKLTRGVLLLQDTAPAQVAMAAVWLIAASRSFSPVFTRLRPFRSIYF